MWICPSNTVDVKTMVEDQWDSYGAFHVQYSYFARVDRWAEELVTHPNALTAGSLSGNRLLMADTCYRWGTDGGWMYNHGRYGAYLHLTDWATGDVEKGPPSITGLNQLYGDTHVEWMDRGCFDPELMDALDASQGQVYGGNQDASFYAIP